jgi:hypothetical protein
MKVSAIIKEMGAGKGKTNRTQSTLDPSEGNKAEIQSSDDASILKMLRDLQEEKSVQATVVNGISAYPQGNGSSWLRLRSTAKTPVAGGKYLFFSGDPGELVALACTELREHEFSSAKVSVSPSAHQEHCLCLYWQDDARTYELTARHSETKFCGFKTEEETHAGTYSPDFLEARRQRSLSQT